MKKLPLNLLPKRLYLLRNPHLLPRHLRKNLLLLPKSLLKSQLLSILPQLSLLLKFKKQSLPQLSLRKPKHQLPKQPQ